MNRRRVAIAFGAGLGLTLLVGWWWWWSNPTMPAEPIADGRLLSAWLDDLRPGPRGTLVYSARVVGMVQAIGPAAVPSLMAWFQAPRRPINHAARFYLGQVFPIADQIPTNQDKWDRAGDGLKILGPAGRAAWPMLIRTVLHHPDEPTRNRAREILENSDRATLDQLVAGLKDTDPEVRCHAIAAISVVGRTAADEVALPALEAATTDPDPRVRAEATQAIRLFTTNLKSYVSWLALNHRGMQVHALKIIGSYRSRASEYLADLEPLTQNADPQVSAAATQAIEQMRGVNPLPH